MKTHDLRQGSPAWLAYRAQHLNASDAPAMMGCSPYKTRARLLREMHTGVAAEADAGQQKRFDNGHRAEALARPLAEEFIGQELYPVTGSEGRLSASFDGLTLDESIGFEHKALNDELRAAFADMATRAPSERDRSDGKSLPLMHRVQMEQQLMISGAERVLFMASAWDAEGGLIEEQHCWYYSDPLLRQQILDGWAQFERDLAAYVLPEAAEVVAAEPQEHLPAVSVQVTGALAVASNLDAFGAALRSFVDRIPKKPSTDTEFATAEAACKRLKEAEDRLAAAEDAALGSMADVNAMRRTVATLRELARETRLASEKIVKARKDELRLAEVQRGNAAYAAHARALGERVGLHFMPPPANLGEAIKGLKTLDSVRNAVDTALASAKIAASALADKIDANLKTLAAVGASQLFSDREALALKAPDDLAAIIAQRLAAEARREAERQAAEAARIAAAEQRAREQEAQRLAAEQARQAAAAAAASAAASPAPAPAPAPIAPPATVAPPPPPRADEPATLKLGAICDRLGFVVSAVFLSDTLHIRPARNDGAAKLYTERQYAAICRQLIAHVGAMAELYAPAEAAA